MSGTDAADRALQAVEGIGSFIRSQRETAQVSLRQLARVAGISNPYLSQIERGLRKPSAEILAQIATGLRISAEVLYVRAGILEARASSPVLDALAADPDLTERQKQVLGDIYGSFRREAGLAAVPTVWSGASAEAAPVVTDDDIDKIDTKTDNDRRATSVPTQE